MAYSAPPVSGWPKPAANDCSTLPSLAIAGVACSAARLLGASKRHFMMSVLPVLGSASANSQVATVFSYKATDSKRPQTGETAWGLLSQ